MTTIKKVRLFKEKCFINTKITFGRSNRPRVIVLFNFDKKKPVSFADVYCENDKIYADIFTNVKMEFMNFTTGGTHVLDDKGNIAEYKLHYISLTPLI